MQKHFNKVAGLGVISCMWFTAFCLLIFIKMFWYLEKKFQSCLEKVWYKGLSHFARVFLSILSSTLHQMLQNTEKEHQYIWKNLYKLIESVTEVREINCWCRVGAYFRLADSQIFSCKLIKLSRIRNKRAYAYVLIRWKIAGKAVMLSLSLSSLKITPSNNTVQDISQNY